MKIVAIKYSLSAILFFVLINKHFAQEYTLEQCIDYAWEYNNMLYSSAIDTKIQKLNHQQAQFALMPNVSMNTRLVENFGRSIDNTTNDYVDVKFFNNSYSISSSLAIFQGFKQINQISFEKYMLYYNQDIYKTNKNNIGFRVISSYHDVLFYNGLQTILQEQLKLSQEELARTKSMIRVGRMAKSDFYEMDARVAADSFLLMQNKHQKLRAMQGLKKLMNFPVTDSLTIHIEKNDNDLLKTNEIIAANDILQTAIQNSAEINALKNRLVAMQKQIKIRYSNLSPSLWFSNGWSSHFSETNRDSLDNILPFNEQISNHAGYYFSLSLNIPIFNRLSGFSSIKRSKLQYEQAKAELENELYAFEQELYLAVLELDAARNEYILSVKNQQKFQMAYSAAQKKREKGLITVVELYASKNELMKAQSEVLRCRLQQLLKYKTVNFLITGSFK